MVANATDHQDRRWTFLTNHARVLLAIARNPDARLRTIAAACLITERAVQAIIADLEQAGYLHRQRVGRRSQYTLSRDLPLRHPAEADLTLRALVDLLVDRENGKSAQSPKPASASATVSKTRRT
ncbi:helix-turn-helix domain-containing protein [Streptomyces sp. ISL-86]|uniref:helix-turn-helix transcriptional regulator n=1 Tax=Streptomyces sp. ISL-86 TaxID=2819187 RepID=UPI001BE61E2F|nr:helix-turn-helix domain-containing protein [Streptomyces sp. ISL-86]MBT2457281.1 MarR family transcriptional regulator [Streptomyces sp. ISL-86]